MWKGLRIQIVQPAHALGPAQLRHLREKEQYGLAHMHPLPLCVKITLQIFSSMLGKLCNMMATTFICLNSHHQLTYIVQHKHMHPSAILKLATSACTRSHTRTDTRKHIHMVCAQARPLDALHSSSKRIIPSDGSVILRPVL